MSLPYFLTPCDHPQHEQLWVEAQKTIARLTALVAVGREMADWLMVNPTPFRTHDVIGMVEKWRSLEGR